MSLVLEQTLAEVVAVPVHWRTFSAPASPIQVSVTISMTSKQKIQVRLPVSPAVTTLLRFCLHWRSSSHPASDSPPDSSPASQKKGGVSGSMIDRLRSPGTVRKLSLKMKKLPELRRKLSLRSSSRAHRQTNDNRGSGEESAGKSTASLLALSNQNVISKYHLDSSTSPARPQRRSSRGCSASKGGKPLRGEKRLAQM